MVVFDNQIAQIEDTSIQDMKIQGYKEF